MILKPLPPLSYSSLTSFAACQRQFALRYMSELGWPLLSSGDAMASEEQSRLGRLFHLAVEQRSHGQDVTRLLDHSPKLHAWWLRFLQKRLDKPRGAVWTEARLQFRLDGQAILAVMDRLQHQSGDWTIWDWKTGRHFEARELAHSWQTRLYRFALAEAGAIFNGGRPIAPEAITMVFWSAEHDRTERFPYDDAGFARDRADLTALLATLRQSAANGFPATGKGVACQMPGRPCPFVPLCFAEGAPDGEADGTWEVASVPADDDDDPFV